MWGGVRLAPKVQLLHQHCALPAIHSRPSWLLRMHALHAAPLHALRCTTAWLAGGGPRIEDSKSGRFSKHIRSARSRAFAFRQA